MSLVKKILDKFGTAHTTHNDTAHFAVVSIFNTAGEARMNQGLTPGRRLYINLRM